MTALTEEVGELAKAIMDEGSHRVWKEAVQVAAMALRVAVEGDPSLDKLREIRKSGKHPSFSRRKNNGGNSRTSNKDS